MRILILGGTRFVGRHLAEIALARGHDVTLFHRGRVSADGIAGARTIRGDREVHADLAPLRSGSWDAVIDTSGYIPSHVRASAEALAHAGHYTFVSTISVYADHATPDADEAYPLGEATEAMRHDTTTASQVDNERYGPLKATCEREVQHVFGERACIVRPGLIVGPFDPTDRFTYWVRRMAQGGVVLVPDALDQRWQFVDVRDLCEWMLDGVSPARPGVFNVTGSGVTAADVFDSISRVSGSGVQFAKASPAFMAAHELFSWQALPFFLPQDAPEYAGFYANNIDRAKAAGFRERALDETIRATLAWDRTRTEPLKMGLSAERELQCIAALGNS
jgi:2'-hydroxyisoflavone reductase